MSPAKTPYRRKFVSICHGGPRDHDGALADEYAVSSIFNYDDSRNLLNSEYSSVTVKLTSMSRRSYALSFDGVQCCVDGTGRSPYH